MRIGEIAHYEQFLLFPQCFQKLSVVDVSKRVSIEYRVKRRKLRCGVWVFGYSLAILSPEFDSRERVSTL